MHFEGYNGDAGILNRKKSESIRGYNEVVQI
jgi:hypothetical protein